MTATALLDRARKAMVGHGDGRANSRPRLWNASGDAAPSLSPCRISAEARAILSALLLAIGAASPAAAADGPGLFNVAAREKQLAAPEFAKIKGACLAVARDPKWVAHPTLAGLKATEDSGGDKRGDDFAWATMVLGGRALAGDEDAANDARALLLRFARANAFARTEAQPEAYVSLKRTLLPTLVTYAIVRDGFDQVSRDEVATWLDPLVRAVDRKFGTDGDADHERYLADAVLSLWGSLTGDAGLYAKGAEGYRTALAAAREDGGLPLEVRRGSRALWYQRQALAALTVIAETAAARGEDLYGVAVGGRSYDRLLGYLMSGLSAPALVRATASANYLPGPSDDFLAQDLGFLERGADGRDLMAFAEPVLARGSAVPARQRLAVVMAAGPLGERPLIDESVGGNATCFWGRP